MLKIETYINKNCKLQDKLCWQYVYMINEKFTKEDITRICRKCIYYKKDIRNK